MRAEVVRADGSRWLLGVYMQCAKVLVDAVDGSKTGLSAARSIERDDQLARPTSTQGGPGCIEPQTYLIMAAPAAL